MKRLITIAILLITLCGCNPNRDFKENDEIINEPGNEEIIVPDKNENDIPKDEEVIIPDEEASKPNDEIVEMPDVEIPPVIETPEVEEIVPPSNLTKKEFEEVIDWLNKEENDYKTYSFLVSGSYTYKGNSYISSYLFDDLAYTTDYIKTNTKARPGTKRDVKWIVIHETGNVSSTADALNHSKYIKNLAIENKSSISWHYTVDMKNIIGHIPDTEIAYHAGDGLRDVGVGNYLGGGNKNGIGIEMCVNKTNDMILTYKRTAKLVAHLMVKYNLGLDEVKKHYDFSGKNCPQTLIYNKMWDEFMECVEAEYLYLTTLSNFVFDIVESVNVDENGKILSSNYDYKIKITNKLTNNSYVYEKKD